MLLRLSLLSLLALAACSDDPKPAEPVAKADGPAAEPALVDDTPAPAAAAAESAVPAPVTTPPVIAVKAMGAAKAGAKGAPAVATKVAAKDEVTKDTLWVFVDGANIRATPSMTGKVVGKLTWSTQVTSLGETNGFVKIAEGQFVHRKMLTDRKARFGQDKSAH